MRLHALERMLEEQDERDRRYGLAHDENEELEREFEPADRIAEQASLAPGDPSCLVAARHQLGRHDSPYEQRHESELRRFVSGESVCHDDGDGPRPGRVVRTLDQEGLVEVDFGRSGTTIVGADAIEPEGT
jgi:hypothetical protein